MIPRIQQKNKQNIGKEWVTPQPYTIEKPQEENS